MYTVVRFSFDALDQITKQELTTILGASAATGGNRTDRGHADRISMSVCVDGTWEDHQAAIGVFIRNANSAIQYAKEHGADVSFDVAIEPEDRAGQAFFSFSPSSALLSQLIESGCTVVFSLY